MVSYSDAYEAGFEDMQRRVPDIAKINRVIGWEPIKSLDQTLDEVIAFFRARNA
jgi:UDP-glucose 4-epimerase